MSGVAPCGTPGAWARHYYLGEPLDGVCRAARSVYVYQHGGHRQRARGRALTRLALHHRDEERALIQAELAAAPRDANARANARKRARTVLSHRHPAEYGALLDDELEKETPR